MKAETPTTARVVDPVCGMTIDSVTAAAETCHDGTRIFFCMTRCHDAFLAHPERFKPSGRRGFWKRFLSRMEKATGGRSMKCH